MDEVYHCSSFGFSFGTAAAAGAGAMAAAALATGFDTMHVLHELSLAAFVASQHAHFQPPTEAAAAVGAGAGAAAGAGLA